MVVVVNMKRYGLLLREWLLKRTLSSLRLPEHQYGGCKPRMSKCTFDLTGLALFPPLAAPLPISSPSSDFLFPRSVVRLSCRAFVTSRDTGATLSGEGDLEEGIRICFRSRSISACVCLRGVVFDGVWLWSGDLLAPGSTWL